MWHGHEYWKMVIDEVDKASLCGSGGGTSFHLIVTTTTFNFSANFPIFSSAAAASWPGNGQVRTELYK